MPKLVVISGKNVGTVYPLSGERLVIGRRSSCGVHIPDPKASREHAVLELRGGHYYLVDMSRNGTLLNGAVLPAEIPEGLKIKPGDRITIAETVLETADDQSESAKIEIPGYIILEKIGYGGMGVVFKAKQISMDRIVAVKVLNERYSNNAEFVDRFIREARAAGKLNHPNVIHVHDISRANGRHYFTMEHIDGPSVRDLLHKEKKLEVNRALDIVLQSARALEFAHANGIIHRDIKPDNIMLTREGIVKIADLGIAKTFEENAGREKRVMGTPHYMAPEQALGKAIDNRVDIYSLGATFYHMLTGHTPFSGESSQDILKAHVKSSLPPMQDFVQGVPEAVCFLVERMMAKLPEKRYPDMGRLIHDIEKIQSGAVQGILPLDPGDSSIQRAVERKSTDPLKRDKREATAKLPEKSADTTNVQKDDDVVTGHHKKSGGGLEYLLLAALFAAAVGAGYYFMAGSVNKTPPDKPGAPANNDPKNDPNKITPPKPPDDNGTKVSPLSRPEAKKLLDAAIAAKADGKLIDYETKLNEICSRYASSEEARDAEKRLASLKDEKVAIRKMKAEKLLAEAKESETNGLGSPDDRIAKFKNAKDAAGTEFANITAEAQKAIDRIEAQKAQKVSRDADAAYKVAEEKTGLAKARADFDGARALMKEYVTNYPQTPATAKAAEILAQLDVAADARYKEAEKDATGRDLADAIGVWNKYIAAVKDEAGVAKAKTALQALDTKCEQLATDELGKTVEKAKKNDYFEALTIARTVSKKLLGTKYTEVARSREDALRRQKELYDKVTATITERTADKPVPVPFGLQSPFGDVKWAVSSVRNDLLSFDAIPANKAPGISKKISDLSPQEQYQLYTLFLPRELTPELHKSMAAFCMERGMTTEGENHSKQAGQ